MEAKKDQFPAGLRVLVVDDDRTCLYIIDKMLRRCSYTVTTCGLARIALAMLRENKDKFDLVISDVYMPDMDGFKLLELVGLEMDLPVIMMSANGETSVVMKGITHGACDYLLKPIRMEELRNIWQHVVRKKRIASKDTDQSTSADEKINKRASDDCDPTMSTSSKRRKDVKEEDDDNDPESDDPSTLKKPRVVWSVELHQQFVNAVNRLGIEKAVPKRILELMNVQGLTRENVASHLQKYRLYLKRLSGAHHQNGMALSFGSVSDSPFSSVNVLDGLGDLRTHSVIGQTPNPAFTALHWAYLNRMCPTNSMSAPTLDSSALIQSAALQAASRGHVSRPQIPAVVGQASFLHSLGHDMEHNASGQITSFGHLRSPIDDVTGIHCAQNQIVTASGLGGLSTIGGMNCNSSTINTTLMSQQQQHSQQAAASLTLPVGTTRQQLMPELSRGQLSSLCLKTGDLGSPTMKVNPLGLCGAVSHTEGLVNTCDMENRNDAFGVLGSNCSESSDMSFNMVGVKTNNATAARDFNLDLEFQEDRKPYIKSPDIGRFGSPHKGNDQSLRAGWQGLNLNPGFSTTSSCSYPSVSIGGPNANISASQVQVEADPLEDAKRTSSTSNRFYARGGQHVEQVMGKIKEERTLDSVINGFSTEQVLPDDILNFFFKQTCDNDSSNAVIQQDGYWRVPSTDGLFAVPEL